MDDRQFEEKVKQLAATLKARGIAASDTRAREMAADIVRTERKQLADHDKKRYDPSLNPQQRVVDEAIRRVEEHAQHVDVDAGVDTSRPISELLNEEAPTQTPAPSPQPVPGPRPMAEPTPRPAPEPAPIPEARPEPVPRPQPAPAPAPQPEARPAPQPAPAPAPEPVEVPRPASAPSPQAAPARQIPEPPADPEHPNEPLATGAKEIPNQPRAEKPQQEKVDLNEMFNFAKRKS